MSFTHLNLFYDSRANVFIQNSSPANNPNTDLSEVPRHAEIHFEHGPTREVSESTFDDPEISEFLLGRALLDPDATVVPV